MRRFVYIASAILIATLVLGLANQFVGISSQSGGSGDGHDLQALGFSAFLIPIGGAFLLGLNLFLKRSAVRELWSSSVGKAGMFTAISILFGPVLALFMQSFVILSHYEIIGESGMMTVLALFYFVFVLAFGNYVAAAKRTIGGGFNTPWTRDNDIIWLKTQRFLGRNVMVMTLFAMVALYFAEPKPTIFAHLAVLLAIKLLAAGYSYLLWRREKYPARAFGPQ